MDTENISKLIDQMGGATSLAKLCNIEPQAVSQWKHKGIPPARRQFLELKFPEVFNAKSASNQAA